MALKLADTKESDIQLKKYSACGTDTVQATLVGLRFPGQVLEFGHWKEIGVRIARTADSAAWCLGDWLVYGESRYADRYRQAIEVVGLNYQTLRNYAWVARRFPVSRRRDTLTLYHHMEVARLPADEQDRWLSRAADQGWSVRQLRRQVKEDEPGGEPITVPPAGIGGDPQRHPAKQPAGHHFACSLSSADAIRNLRKDPSLRFTEAGRVLLHVLSACAFEPGQWAQIAETVPAHQLDTVAILAVKCARAWQDFADSLGELGTDRAPDDDARPQRWRTGA